MTEPANVQECVEQWLEGLGADGLYDPHSGCVCPAVDDLLWCESGRLLKCIPAYRHKDRVLRPEKGTP